MFVVLQDRVLQARQILNFFFVEMFPNSFFLSRVLSNALQKKGLDIILGIKQWKRKVTMHKDEPEIL
jgi:hypothetical protein